MSTPARDSTTPLADIGERAVIALIRDRFPSNPATLPVGIGDDAAVAEPVPRQLEVLTTDALVEGVHFDLAFSSLSDVGYKALAVNASDVASMGAKPRLALLSLMLPAQFAVGHLEQLLDGFAEMATLAGITVAGGNVTRSPGPLIVDVTLTGSVERRRVLTRSGGRPGDALYLSGSIGGAAAGLGLLRSQAGRGESLVDSPGCSPCVARHRRPEPRLRLGLVLGRTRAASACMDLSDGLADAVTQLAAASGTGAVVDAASLPIPDAAARWFTSQGQDAVHEALSGGDDYELLFSVSPRNRGRLKMVLEQSGGVAVTRIGELTALPPIVLMRSGSAEPLPHGFAHF